MMNVWEYRLVIHSCGQEIYLNQFYKPHVKTYKKNRLIYELAPVCPKCSKPIWIEFDRKNN